MNIQGKMYLDTALKKDMSIIPNQHRNTTSTNQQSRSKEFKSYSY